MFIWKSPGVFFQSYLDNALSTDMLIITVDLVFYSFNILKFWIMDIKLTAAPNILIIVVVC